MRNITKSDFDRKNAFTLIELMVVLAIIGILASIIIYNVTIARRRANNASTLSSLVNVQRVAAQCLYADYYLTGSPTSAVPPVGLLTYTPSTTSICQDPSIVGTWPTINLKSSNGGIWSIDPLTQGQVGSSTASTALSIQAVTNLGTYVVGDFAVNCTLTGCVKEICTTAAAGACSAWTPTTTDW